MRTTPRHGHWACAALVAACASAWPSAVQSTDVLYMRKGEEHVGRLVSIDAGKVVFVDEDHGPLTFDAKDVQRVELGKSRPGDHWKTVKDIDDPVLLQALQAQVHAAASGYVTLYQETTARLAANGASTFTTRTIQKVLQERGKSAANKALYYLSLRANATIDFGRTITPDGKVFSVADSAIQDGSVYTQFPEYQDLNRKQCALREVKPGSVIDYQTTVTTRQTDVLRPFFVHELFAGSEPILKKVVRVIVPRDQACVYQMKRCGDVSVETRAMPDGTRHYKWTVENTPELTREDDMPVTEDMWPRLAFGPTARWDDLARVYAQKLAPLTKPGDRLRAQVEQLVAGQATADGKARAIHRFLVRNLRTIPVSFYVHKLVPRDVNAVLETKYGNDLEKSLLAVAMFREAGLDAHLALARPQGRGELMVGVPSLGQMSACLVRVRAGDRTYYCEVVDDNRPIDVPAGGLQGVWCLIIDDAKPERVKTPLAPAEAEGVAHESEVAIGDRGVFDVRETTRYAGQASVGMRNLRMMKDAERKRYFQQMVADVHTNAELVSYKLSDLSDLEAPVVVKLHYRLMDYAVRAGDKLMIFRLPGLNYSAYGVGKPDRMHPLDWTTRDRSSHRYTVRLPKGWRVRYVPSPVQVAGAPFSYTSKFEAKGDTVTFEDESRRDVIAAPASQYAAYKAGVEAMAKLAKEWVVLERK